MQITNQEIKAWQRKLATVTLLADEGSPEERKSMAAHRALEALKR